MLTLRRPYLKTRQMNTGTVDFRPVNGTGLPALPNQSGQAPDYDTIGIGLALAGTQQNTVNEVLCLLEYSGGESPAVVSDRRLPDIWRVEARTDETSFDGASDEEVISNFQSAVVALRASHGSPIAVMLSAGVRHGDLQPKASFGNLSQAPGTFDLFDNSGEVAGCAFLVRTDVTTTAQHWVQFGNAPFDAVQCVRRASGGYTNLHAFLDAMQDLRDASPIAFAHAVEQVTHHLDVPWS